MTSVDAMNRTSLSADAWIWDLHGFLAPIRDRRMASALHWLVMVVGSAS